MLVTNIFLNALENVVCNLFNLDQSKILLSGNGLKALAGIKSNHESEKMKAVFLGQENIAGKVFLLFLRCFQKFSSSVIKNLD